LIITALTDSSQLSYSLPRGISADNSYKNVIILQDAVIFVDEFGNFFISNDELELLPTDHTPGNFRSVASITTSNCTFVVVWGDGRLEHFLFDEETRSIYSENTLNFYQNPFSLQEAQFSGSCDNSSLSLTIFGTKKSSMGFTDYVLSMWTYSSKSTDGDCEWEMISNYSIPNHFLSPALTISSTINSILSLGLASTESLPPNYKNHFIKSLDVLWDCQLIVCLSCNDSLLFFDSSNSNKIMFLNSSIVRFYLMQPFFDIGVMGGGGDSESEMANETHNISIISVHFIKYGQNNDNLKDKTLIGIILLMNNGQIFFYNFLQSPFQTDENLLEEGRSFENGGFLVPILSLANVHMGFGCSLFIHDNYEKIMVVKNISKSYSQLFNLRLLSPNETLELKVREGSFQDAIEYGRLHELDTDFIKISQFSSMMSSNHQIITHPIFKNLMCTLSSSYDWIISQCLFCQAESLSLQYTMLHYALIILNKKFEPLIGESNFFQTYYSFND